MQTNSKNSRMLHRLKALGKGYKSQRVSEYVKSMRIKAWKYAPPRITYKNDGTIIDGHHRIWAITNSAPNGI